MYTVLLSFLIRWRPLIVLVTESAPEHSMYHHRQSSQSIKILQ